MSDSLINSGHWASAREARILIAISFHFVERRLVYLDKVVRSLASFPSRRREVVVFTNTTDAAQQQAIRDIFRKAGLVDGDDALIEVEAALAHPYHLTWAHKRLIAGPFLAPYSPYSHFIYLEDDEELTFENFAYFLAARDFLRPFDNLVPGFLRTEWSATRQCRVNTDHLAPMLLTEKCFIAEGDHAFIAADVPYWGGFILDQELAREYVHSRSFHLKRSRAVHREGGAYGARERSAMGMTFENPPAPFPYRMVIPVSVASRTAPECAWLAHLPNNYADDPNVAFGKIPMTNLFDGKLEAKKEVTLPAFNSARRKGFRWSSRAFASFRARLREGKFNILDALRGIKRRIVGPGAANRE